jgi:DNA-binding response OmpR family regulator
MPGRVLIIEDDQPYSAFLCKALSRANFEAKAVSDAVSALDIAPEYQPDFILLDMHLPRMNGWQFIEEYAKTPDSHAAIIVSTVVALDPRSLPGIAGYLQKPYRFAQLLDLLV